MTEHSKKAASPVLYGAITQIGAPKALFFAAAGISFCLSVWLWFSGDRERGLFVGLWVPSILSAATLLVTEARHD